MLSTVGRAASFYPARRLPSPLPFLPLSLPRRAVELASFFLSFSALVSSGQDYFEFKPPLFRELRVHLQSKEYTKKKKNNKIQTRHHLETADQRRDSQLDCFEAIFKYPSASANKVRNVFINSIPKVGR